MIVSIIMPAYNAGKYIAETIDSVIAQTYDNWELIIVDDGSTDNTKALVDNYVQKDPRIHYYYQTNGRQGKARNHAFAKSHGEMIAFLDSDDLWLPTKLESQLTLIKNKNVDLVFGSSYTFYQTILDNPEQKIAVKEKKYEAEEAVKDFLAANKIPILTVLMKREALAKVNGFSEKPEIQNAEDYHLWLNLLLNGASFYGQSDILAAYRLHKTSSSSIDYESNIQCLAAIHDLTKEDFYWQKVIPFFNRNRIYSAIRLIKHEPPHIFNNKLKIYLMWGGYKKISTLVSMPFIRWSKKLTTMTVYKLLKGYEQ